MTEPERIDPAEAAYLLSVFTRAREAEKQIATAQQTIVAAQQPILACRDHGLYLAQKYGLGPSDRIDPTDGVILRGGQGGSDAGRTVE